MKCSVLKELKLTAGQALKRKAVSDRVMRTHAKQQAALALLQRKVKYYERECVLRRTAIFSERNRDEKRSRAGRVSSDSGGSSPEEPEGKCNRKR